MFIQLIFEEQYIQISTGNGGKFRFVKSFLTTDKQENKEVNMKTKPEQKKS